MKRISVILALVLVSASLWCFHPNNTHAAAAEPTVSAAAGEHAVHCEVHDARLVANGVTLSVAVPAHPVHLLPPPQFAAGVHLAATQLRITAERSTLFHQFVLIQV